ncbi:molybdopterin-dependent oxidoreductase [Acidimicrobiaceae bacterium USS-CC1]|uniref:Molybdopterin-dependent oxidoreductase n=1 Tax=Acidiferrimicrobium australe TaxID=2664430 RepID=A0ABW9QXJ3_9ACTN|nr:molybdopterin-dependent oxidoreductase [Acidiferrimicrobium australe]
MPDGAGGWAVGESLAEARAAAGVPAGRRSGRPLTWPLELPAGDWAATLRTTWVEPGYLEPDASWCVPGGEPVSALANGGAFGGKLSSVAPAAARRLADESGRPVRVVLGREDVVRMGAKRPPVAIGVLPDGSGVARVARTPGIADAIRAAAPDLVIEEIDLAGPPTSAALRAAGWAEAALVLAAARGDRQVTVRAPDGGEATATVDVAEDGRPVRVRVTVACGDPLDAVVLRSYVVGAAHMALGWVCSEGIAVDEEGRPEDLTIRSWGILRAVDTPPIEVTIADGGGPPVNGSDAAFAAVAAATWVAQGRPPALPTMRDLRRG